MNYYELLGVGKDSSTDDIASFISGIQYGDDKCLSKYDSLIKWHSYADSDLSGYG